MTILTVVVDEGLSLSVEVDRYVFDRWEYKWRVTTPDAIHTGGDLRSGCMDRSDPPEPLAKMMASLLSFASACADSYPYGSNADLFPTEVGRIFDAYGSDMLTTAQYDACGGDA